MVIAGGTARDAGGRAYFELGVRLHPKKWQK
jgi:hypothetical protein